MGGQTRAVLALLEARGARGVTALDALGELGVFRLAARVLDLHEAGYAITSTIETLPNGKRIARYRLEGTPAAAPAPARQLPVPW
jgi:hypothetical protein